MYQIDDPTAAGTKPAPASEGTKGWFQQTDPAGKTKIIADWLNSIQGEIVTFLTNRGITQVKANVTQLYAAVVDMIQSDGSGTGPVINPFMNYLHVKDVKAQGVAATGLTASSYSVRDLTTIVANNIDAGITVVGNQILGLPEGTYRVEATAPIYIDSGSTFSLRSRLKVKINGGADLAFGASPSDNSGSTGEAGFMCTLSGTFSFPAGTPPLELLQYNGATIAAAGGAVFNIAGESEYYSDIKLYKIA